MRVYIHAVVPSDSMLITLPVKSTRWAHRLWRMAEASSAEYLKVRSMHVMREVLATHDDLPALVAPPRLSTAGRHMAMVLLEAGCLPLRSFLKFHAATRTFLHRAAVMAVSSAPPPAEHLLQRQQHPTVFAHPCEESHFVLSDSLRGALSPVLGGGGGLGVAGTGGSLGLNRRGFLELYVTLGMHKALDLRGALQWLQMQDKFSRYFLHPAQHLSVELEIGLDGHEFVAEEGAGVSRDGENQACHSYDGLLNRLAEGANGEGGERGERRADGEHGSRGVSVDECAMMGWSPRLSARRVYDAVTYLNEHKMLLLRMHELNASVDVHVVVEGDLSFRGMPVSVGLFCSLIGLF